MATPLDQLSPAYRKRVERAMAKAEREGRAFNRQAARGHKAREHVERRDKEIETYGLSRAEQLIIRAFVERNNGFKGWDEDDFLDYFREAGYPAFKEYRTVWEAARRRYLSALRDGSHASQGEGYLNFLTASAGVDDTRWLYYH